MQDRGHTLRFSPEYCTTCFEQIRAKLKVGVWLCDDWVLLYDWHIYCNVVLVHSCGGCAHCACVMASLNILANAGQDVTISKCNNQYCDFTRRPGQNHLFYLDFKFGIRFASDWKYMPKFRLDWMKVNSIYLLGHENLTYVMYNAQETLDRFSCQIAFGTVCKHILLAWSECWQHYQSTPNALSTWFFACTGLQSSRNEPVTWAYMWIIHVCTHTTTVVAVNGSASANKSLRVVTIA